MVEGLDPLRRAQGQGAILSLSAFSLVCSWDCLCQAGKECSLMGKPGWGGKLVTECSGHLASSRHYLLHHLPLRSFHPVGRVPREQGHLFEEEGMLNPK